MADLKMIYDDAKRTRDEIALKVHLGSRELQDEWERLEQRTRVRDGDDLLVGQRD